MLSKPKIVVWNVISKCNLRCGFCYGPKKQKRRELTTKEALEKIGEFKKQGASSLVFTGGEPLLRKDIVKLVKKAKEQELFTILHTNGFLLNKGLLDKLGKWLDQINLPLDGFDEETNALTRGKGHFKKVMNCLNLLKNRKMRVVISTVATRINKDFVVRISKILPDFLYKWRIFQFSSQGKARKVRDKYGISKKEFERIRKETEKLDLPFKVQFVANTDKKFRDSYYII